MGVKVTNNAYGTISTGITSTATTITLDSGQGNRFPTLGAGDYFYATLIDTSNNLEVVKVTARSTDSMTVTRGEDNTTARAFSIGDRFELRPTAALFEDIISGANVAGITSNSTSGTAITIDSSNDVKIENGLGIGVASPTTPLEINAPNSLGASFTGTSAGEGVEVSQTNYTAGNYVSLIEGKYLSTQASPSVRVGAMYDGNGSHMLFGTSNNYASGITQIGVEIDEDGRVAMPEIPVFCGVDTSNRGSYAGSSYAQIIASPQGAQPNNGSYYNTSTGNFVCPVAGFYEVSYHWMSSTASANGVYHAVYGFPFRNGSQAGGGLAYNYGDGYVHAGGTWVYECAKNDILSMRVTDQLGSYNALVIKFLG
jgi:hypothetical protein